MKITFLVALLATLAGVALPRTVAYGAPATSQQSTAQPPAPKPATAPGAAKPAAPAAAVMTNRNVIQLVAAKTSDDVIIAKIKQSKTRFDTSTQGVVALKKGGVSEQLIAAMASSKPALRPSGPPSNAQGTSLAAQGKVRYQLYGCKDCHGEHGEGTEDAPDLTGTHLNADQIAAFLNKPSADASAKGMPTVGPTSPDLKFLVAYVLSLKDSKAK